MVRGITNSNNKYFCKRCKDRNWIIECLCGCKQTRSRCNKAGEIKQFISNHHHRGINGYDQYNKFRKCLFYYECFKTEQYNGTKWQEKWSVYKDGFICSKHQKTKIDGERRKHRDTDKIWRSKRTPEARRKERDQRVPRQIYFKTKSITFSYITKTGYCSWCSNNKFDGSCKRTHNHHIEYYVIFPWFATVELCVSCHKYETERLKKLRKGL